MSLPAASPDSRPAPALRWVALGCALLVWVLGLLAFSPATHGGLHDDAHQPEHTCAITLFSHGVEAATGSIQLACEPVLFAAGESALPRTIPAAEAHYRLPPGRGPPVS
jgi:hypothetical protein